MIKERFVDSLQHIKRDALAGSVAGIMAVPLTVGICIMSDYPVMTGIYTVIFATIISYLSYLIRPGNYIGTPGVAAGLAPALALGVSSFGMENMPFVIALTAIFQMIVWKYKLESLIFKFVPHYLVEGLLAGVGLKIAFKFVPFLYDIQHESEHWLNLEREIIIILSVVSFLLFVLLYRYYQKKMPALPYVVIMLSSFALTFFLPLPMLNVDPTPFELRLPFPNFEGLSNSESLFLILKMVGFALMLGSIDVIEQVMSNVAIEKLDPLGRKCNTNNSLLAIWIANLGSSFFGGMTNLDGLAKSTTNAVAGAVTKLSNLFTAFVLLIVVAFPQVLGYAPEYALGIIMVYSGWKMIANIQHVRAEGRYALIMAGICALLVFQFGIFEGLLMVLAFHGLIQYVFLRRLGKSTSDILKPLVHSRKRQELHHESETLDYLNEKEIPVLTKWLKAINEHNLNLLASLYSKDSVYTPALSTRQRFNKDQIMDYYRDLFAKDNVKIERLDMHKQYESGLKIDSGHLGLKWTSAGHNKSHVLRFSMVIKDGQIIAHHSSLLPTGDVTIALWAQDEEKGKSGFIF